MLVKMKNLTGTPSPGRISLGKAQNIVYSLCFSVKAQCTLWQKINHGDKEIEMQEAQTKL